MIFHHGRLLTYHRANKYAENYHPVARSKAMLLCRVVLGKPFRTTQDIPSLHAPPDGYDSVSTMLLLLLSSEPFDF